ncbi:MAG: hypothetical protein EOM30_09735 [Clostridia bacterium]|nr:hypothetical protein [Clostridia bacterium]NLS85224.1 hypothetical protein [Oscillospiraceae bacterium]
MRKLLVLLKLNFRALLSSFSGGRSGKKKKMGMLGATLLLGGLAVYLSVIYSMLMGDALSQVGLLDSMLPLMAAMSCVMALMMTVFAASGFIFGGKDSDLMLSLPVSPFVVMLSKLLALYIENLLFCFLWMIPTGVAYIIYGGSLSVAFCINLVLVALFLPFIPSLVGMLIGVVISWMTANLKKNVILSNVVYFLFFAVVIILCSQVNSLGAILIQNSEGFNALLATWLLPFGLLQKALTTAPLHIISFMLICAVPFVIVTYIFSISYKKLLTLLTSHKMRSDYKLGRLGAKGQTKALVNKEFGRYFSSTIYVFNTAFGTVMLIMAAAAAVIMRGTVMFYVEIMGGVTAVLPLLATAIIALAATVDTSSVSISLEGKTLWILREAPVTPAALFGAKALVCFSVAMAGVVISAVVIGIAYGIPAVTVISIILAGAAISANTAVSGLWINLLLPKMDASNDTVVVKQSASAMVGMLYGVVIAGAGIAILLMLNPPLELFCIVYAIIVTIITIVFWRLLLTKGYQRLAEI